MAQQQNVTSIRPRMNPRPAPRKQPDTAHTYHDLTPKVRRGDLYFFTAPSGSTTGKINTVVYCPTDDTTLCDCYAAEFGRACWHVRLVREAWLVRLARTELADYTKEELARVEREAAALVHAGIDAEKNGAIAAAVADEWQARLVAFPQDEPDPTPPATPGGRAITPLHALAPTGTEGYHPMPPPRSVWLVSDTIDTDVCAAARCEACGHAGLDYRPFYRPAPRSYRAFAVCPQCQHTIEF